MLAGDTGCDGCGSLLSWFFATPSGPEKKCVASAAHGGGSGRYQMGR
jgi:hypothetical protein